jgi:hypothetical protein
MKTYIGIDNGTSGSIGIICGEDYYFFKTPAAMAQDYTKTKKNISRIVPSELMKIFSTVPTHQRKAVIERPMVNPGRFAATISAVRCLESTLCILEAMEIPYEFVDSKNWQKVLLPSGCVKEELKTASRDIATRLFPQYANEYKKQGDGDGMLIAEYARRMNL